MIAWRHAGTSTVPSSASGGLSSGCSSLHRPSALACADGTRRVWVTAASACDSDAALPTSNGRCCQCSLRPRSSASDRPCWRVSIGNSDSRGGVPSSKRNSTGHIVVRPGVAGSTRRPVSAKKMALMSSDLPRENSATKASTSLSDDRRSCSAVSTARSASSARSWSASSMAHSARWWSTRSRQATSASRLWAMGLCTEGIGACCAC